MKPGESDPTIQSPLGPAKGSGGHWQVSMAEIDGMCRKAARGAGLAWGLAEEAGRAACHLAAWGQPGPEALLSALTTMEGDIAVHASDGAFRATAPLCPLRVGAALSDRAHALDGSTDLADVIEPILLVPFLMYAARRSGSGLALTGRGIAVEVSAAGPICDDWSGLRGISGPLILRRAVVKGATSGALPDPRRVSVEVWRGLGALAHRTYVPASAASRAGAGAGTVESD